jgi:hypothetical protein
VKTPQSEEYSDEETKRRRDNALRRALNTPHKLHDEMKIGKKREPDKKPSPRRSSRQKSDDRR